jgi:hypothetical protein
VLAFWHRSPVKTSEGGVNNLQIVTIPVIR